MSPLKIDILLRMKAFPQPFAGMPDRQIHAPAMIEAFAFFRMHGLLADGVTHSYLASLPPFRNGEPVKQCLSFAGERLVHAICSIEPGQVP